MHRTGFFVRYRSRFNGAPCIAVATKSKNRKTGKRTVQIWFMRADMEPRETLRHKLGKSICGGCPFIDEGCYVIVSIGPLQVWRAWARGSYTELPRENPGRIVPNSWKRRHVRHGSYGDPGSAPESVYWTFEAAFEPEKTSLFTHAWRDPHMEWLKPLGMASVEDPISAYLARKAGWRTFRIRCGGALMPGESVCANERSDILCENCGRCGLNGGPLSPVITVHGYRSRKAAAKVVDFIV